MHSLVARLRGRAASQTTTASIQEEDNVPPTPDTPTLPHGFQEGGPRSPVDQKILPQVHELMDSFSHVDITSTGLSPPPIRRQVRRVSEPSSSQPGPSVSSVEGGRSDSPAASEVSSLRGSRSNLSRFSRRVASSGVWSTFGRHSSGVSPRSSRIDQQSARTRFTFGSVDTLAIPRQSDVSRLDATRTLASSVSLDRYGRPSFASESPGTMRMSSDTSSRGRPLPLASTHDEPTNDLSTSTDTTPSRRNSTKHSVATRSSHSTQSHSASVHTPLTHTFDLDSSSPHTFGQTSPGTPSVFVTSGSPPPPLPPLNHPELIASITRSQSMLRDLSNHPVATPPLRHWTSELHGKTFPPRRRRRKTNGSPGDENSISFPSAARRTLRAYASFPRVRQLFQPEQRPRSDSSVHLSRRSSAEWSAHQATFGVVDDSSVEYGWPAAVSKEILRLSLGDDAAGKSRKSKDASVSATSVDPDIIHRVRNNVPAGSGEESGRPCSPLLSPNPAPAHPDGWSPPLASLCSSLTPSIVDQLDARDEPPKQGLDVDDSLSKPVGVDEVDRGMNAGDSSTLDEAGDYGFRSATLPRPARTPRKSILRQSSPLALEDPEVGPSTPFNGASPSPRRSSGRHPARHSSEPALASVLETPTNNKGKRKAEDLDITPPDQRNQHTTFVIPADHRSEYRHVFCPELSQRASLIGITALSEGTQPPSAYQQRKRVRLSSSPFTSPGQSRPGSVTQNAPSAGPSSLRPTVPPSPAARAISRASRPTSTRGSTRSMQQSIVSGAQPSVADSRRSKHSQSESSIPVGAIIAAHPPSLGRSSTYHMRDPRRPPRVQPTPWSLRMRSDDEEGSPIHAWLFFIGFVPFPVWWLASFWRIPETRRVGGTDTEKAVTLDDPQVEHGAYLRYRSELPRTKHRPSRR